MDALADYGALNFPNVTGDSVPDRLPLGADGRCPEGYYRDYRESPNTCRPLPAHASRSPYAGTPGAASTPPERAEDNVPWLARGILGTTEALGLPERIPTPDLPDAPNATKWTTLLLAGLALLAVIEVARVAR